MAKSFVVEDVWSRVDKRPDGCWIWTGSKNSKGYGRLNVYGRFEMAHNYIYRTVVGDPPVGLQPDHLCRVTSCVNPEHIEYVTALENMRRRTCSHACNHDDWYIYPNGKRRCRPCRRANRKY